MPRKILPTVRAGRFVIVDYFNGPPVKTVAATRAWIKAGRPTTRDVYRVRAVSVQAAWEHQFGSPGPGSKFRSRSAKRARDTDEY